ncbi:hypothetical protein [Streptomyces niveus]|nr:hypothetical protein [Streptomyces niveus]
MAYSLATARAALTRRAAEGSAVRQRGQSAEDLVVVVARPRRRGG